MIFTLKVSSKSPEELGKRPLGSSAAQVGPVTNCLVMLLLLVLKPQIEAKRNFQTIDYHLQLQAGTCFPYPLPTLCPWEPMPAYWLLPPGTKLNMPCHTHVCTHTHAHTSRHIFLLLFSLPSMPSTWICVRYQCRNDNCQRDPPQTAHCLARDPVFKCPIIIHCAK